jgi:hypothetical protein
VTVGSTQYGKWTSKGKRIVELEDYGALPVVAMAHDCHDKVGR